VWSYRINICMLFRHTIYHRLCDGRTGETWPQVSSCFTVTSVVIFHVFLCCAICICFFYLTLIWKAKGDMQNVLHLRVHYLYYNLVCVLYYLSLNARMSMSIMLL